mmetsp:Transcript_20910/g.30321  ORF Transcript_20910/g.30321 Transcript_20910/m.30321 type:complete len:92 (+) Transcript_20910:28-303(+)
MPGEVGEDSENRSTMARRSNLGTLMLPTTLLLQVGLAVLYSLQMRQKHLENFFDENSVACLSDKSEEMVKFIETKNFIDNNTVGLDGLGDM